jgi:hypothetical protein
MQLIALLSWYDEKPAWLKAAVRSLAKLQVDHVVAVDGAYALLAAGRNRSASDQHLAIIDAAHERGMGVTVHGPRARWRGNEIEKRSFMFELAAQIAAPGDWYVVFDADELVSDCDVDVKAALATTDRDVAHVLLWEHERPSAVPAAQRRNSQRAARPRESLLRMFFRALPGLHVRDTHYTYVAGDGRVLWGNPTHHELAQSLDMSIIRVEHRTWLRDPRRHEQQYGYYRRREEQGHERPRCAWCENRSVRTVPWDWSVVHGTSDLAAGWIEVCADHERRAWAESEAQLAALGFDVTKLKPGDLQLTQGKVPA